MSRKYPKYNDERSQKLLASLRGEGPDLDEVRADPDTALDVIGAVVDILETMPDVTHKQRRIAHLLSRNNLPVEVAAKVNCTASYVRALMPDPRITELVKLFRGGKIYDFADDIGAREVLKRAATRAAEVLAEKMNNAVDESTQIRAAVEILKATGEIGGDGRVVTEINIGRDAIKIFQRAVEDDADDDAEDDDIQEGDYEVVPPSLPDSKP